MTTREQYKRAYHNYRAWMTGYMSFWVVPCASEGIPVYIREAAKEHYYAGKEKRHDHDTTAHMGRAYT